MNYETATNNIVSTIAHIAKENQVDRSTLAAAVLGRVVQDKNLTANDIIPVERRYNDRRSFMLSNGFGMALNREVEGEVSTIVNEAFSDMPQLASYMQAKAQKARMVQPEINTEILSLAVAQVMPTLEVAANAVPGADLSLDSHLMAKMSLARQALQDTVAGSFAYGKLPLLTKIAKIFAHRTPITGANMNSAMQNIHGAVPCSSLNL